MDRQAFVFVAVISAALVIAGIVLSGGIPLWQFFLLLLVGVPVVLFFPYRVVVKEYERIVVFRFGKFVGVQGPGWFWHFSRIETYERVDLRVQAVDIPPQQVITRDNIEFTIDAVIYLKVVDAEKAITTVKDYKGAAVFFTQTQIRNSIGKLLLEEVIARTEEVNEQARAALDDVASKWGIKTVKVEIQTITPPEELVVAMRKRMEAQVLKARVETEAQARQVSIDILDKAASKMSDRTLAYLYLDALKKIADGKSSKIIFPLELSRLASVISKTLSPARSDEMKTAVKDLSSETKKGRGGDEVDYDKVVDELLKAYRRKQSEFLDDGGSKKVVSS
ncbi:MAG: SPFH domain-containing protein [Candidatus Micrarchaeia archaeon]